MRKFKNVAIRAIFLGGGVYHDTSSELRKIFEEIISPSLPTTKQSGCYPGTLPEKRQRTSVVTSSLITEDTYITFTTFSSA